MSIHRVCASVYGIGNYSETLFFSTERQVQYFLSRLPCTIYQYVVKLRHSSHGIGRLISYSTRFQSCIPRSMLLASEY